MPDTIYTYYWNRSLNGFGNFGDITVKTILLKLTEADVVHTINNKKSRLICTGSLIGNSTKIYDSDIIWGTGAMYNKFKFPNYVSKKADIRCVRGPYTRKALLDNLGINAPVKYCDPGVLLPWVYNCHKKDKPKYKYGVILHFKDYNSNANSIFKFCKKMKEQNKLCLIKINDHPKNVILKISDCELILSSSLHGIIVAEAMGIPAAWIELSDNVEGNGFKFFDYFLGTGRTKSQQLKTDWSKTIDINKINILPKANIDFNSLLSSFPYKLKDNIVKSICKFYNLELK